VGFGKKATQHHTLPEQETGKIGSLVVFEEEKMKKALLLGVGLLLVANVASAQLPPTGYIGLFADAERAVWCVGPGSYTIYCYALPTPDGLDSVEFNSSPTPNVIVYMPELNDDIILSMGNFPGDLVATFGTCWLEWTVVATATMLVSDANLGGVTLGNYTGSTMMKMVDCVGDEEEMLEYTHIYANDPDCPPEIVASRESTWGAIKNMYE
jgi:hypothetical protein